VIAVPTITLEGDANGVPHQDPSIYAGKFSGQYSHRTIEGGIWHNLPQEAPEAFADAVLEIGDAQSLRHLASSVRLRDRSRCEEDEHPVGVTDRRNGDRAVGGRLRDAARRSAQAQVG